MNERLGKMIRFGILQRKVFGDKPLIEVEYQLTSFGRRFTRIVEEVDRLQEELDHWRIRESSEPHAAETEGGGRVPSP